MEEEIYWIWLSRLRNITIKQIQYLLNCYQTPKGIWTLTPRQVKANKGIKISLQQELLKLEYRENLKQYATYMKNRKIQLIWFWDSRYPSKLKHSANPPAFIYAKGNIHLVDNFSVHLLGCQDLTLYGKETAKKIAFNLVKYNIHIVSGLANTIDTYSQLGCFQGKGKAIIVLDKGLDDLYKTKDSKIIEGILKTGGVFISSYPLKTQQNETRYSYIQNLIGITNAFVVVEAKWNDANIKFIDLALEQGKDIFAIPRQYQSSKFTRK